MDRYRNYPDRPDLVICRDCSSRSTVVTIPRDEVAPHNQLHERNVGWGDPVKGASIPD